MFFVDFAERHSLRIGTIRPWKSCLKVHHEYFHQKPTVTCAHENCTGPLLLRSTPVPGIREVEFLCCLCRLLSAPMLFFVSSPGFQVKTLLAESCSGDKYVQTSVRLDPMNGRQRWLMHEFVGSSTPDVKLCNLPGPAQARPMEASSTRACCPTPSLYSPPLLRVILRVMVCTACTQRWLFVHWT